MANLYDLKKFDLNLLVIFECIFLLIMFFCLTQD